MGTGAIVGAGAVLGFGPLVRAKIQDKADRYGAKVTVARVVPGWRGLTLRGVEMTLEEIPGVRVWLDEVVVDWARQPVATSGGKIVAVGAMSTLMSDFEQWKQAHFKSGGSAGGSSRKLAIDGFAVEWRSAPTGATRSVTASGVSASKAGSQLRAAASKVSAKIGGVELEVDEGVIELMRGEGGYRIAALTTRGMALAYDLGERPAVAPASTGASGDRGVVTNAATSGAPDPARSATAKATTGSKGRLVDENGRVSPAVPARVVTARRARTWAIALAERLDRALEAGAKVELDGARAKLSFGDELLNLGPGSLSLSRTAGDLVVALVPRAAPAPKSQGADVPKPLTFSARVPYAPGEQNEGPEKRAMRVEVHGGPVWLSMLGVHEGDLGLRNVSDTRIEADVVVILPPGEQQLSIDGSGRVHRLSMFDKRLAKAPLENVELAWRAKLDMRLDGSKLTLHEAEIDLGNVRLLLKGTWERRGGEHKVALDYTIPLMTCQSAFTSIPEALVPRLSEMQFAGSLSLKGHARFDTANIKKDYDVDWDGTLSCRVTHAPAEVAVTRFKTSFSKIVYTPKSEERTMTFGPNEKTWVALPSIAHFMTGSVLVTEDGRFYRHRGFDQEAIVNSIQQNIEARRFVRGASTISMQLAKNLYLPRAKTLSRKLQEAVLTMYLEQELTKREMMELYLNVIEYGPMVYGIGPAARHYFNSHPARLSVSQAMYLASILRNPKHQYFGSGGAVIASHMRVLRLYMKVLEKIGRITEDELERGARETVVFGSPAPMLAPAEDDDGYPLDEEPGDPRSDPNDTESGLTQEANTGL